MKKVFLFASAAFLFAGTAFAEGGKGKKNKKKCAMGKTCCKKVAAAKKNCHKDKTATTVAL